MKLRHRLLQWLSFGDLVLMNAELLPDGVLRSREAGDLVLVNVRVDFDKATAVHLGRYASPAAGLSLTPTRSQQCRFRDVRLSRMRRGCGNGLDL